MTVDTQTLKGADDLLRKLKALGKAASKNGGPVRAALRKGANVIANEAKANVRAIVAEENLGGAPSQSTGALEKAIGVVRSKRPKLDGASEAYEVKVRGGILRRYAANKKNTRSGKAGKIYKTEPNEYYGRMLETGTANMRPHPWLALAYMSHRQKALDTVIVELGKAIDRLIKKISKGV